MENHKLVSDWPHPLGMLDTSMGAPRLCPMIKTKMRLSLWPSRSSLLLLMGLSEPQDRCGAVMSDSAAGEIFGQHCSQWSSQLWLGCTLCLPLSLDPELLLAFSEESTHRITCLTSGAGNHAPDASSVLLLYSWENTFHLGNRQFWPDVLNK